MARLGGVDDAAGLERSRYLPAFRIGLDIQSLSLKSENVADPWWFPVPPCSNLALRPSPLQHLSQHPAYVQS